MEGMILGVDIGTSATKTVLFDLKGRIVASASREYPLYQAQMGWAEQDPEDWARATLDTIAEVTQAVGAGRRSILGMGLSGQMHGMVLLDKAGRVLRPAMIWCDQRTQRQCDEITGILGRERLIAITANPALTGFTASKILWVKENQPEIFEKIDKILLPKDYVRYVLTGEFATEVSDASGMQLLDVPQRQWSGEVVSALGLSMQWLPGVYESVEVSGRISPRIAEQTGLWAGMPVVGGAGDNAAGAVGTGVVTPGAAFSTIGTSGVVFAHMDRPQIDPQGRVHTFCHAVPGAWHVMGVIQSAGLSLRWMRDELCAPEREAALQEGIDPYEVMTREAMQSPLGARGLIFLPYLMGERSPHLDPVAKGAFVGLSAVHTRRDMIRSVMEGVGHALQDSMEIIREMQVPVTEVRAGGGGGRSALWRQMQADMFGVPVRTVQAAEGPALGVALLAAVGVGAYDSVQQACGEAISLNAPLCPDQTAGAGYRQLHQVYQGLYHALKPSFDAIASMPGLG